MLQRVFLDEAIERLFQCAGHFRRSPGARAVHEASCPLVRKAMDPFAQRRIGKVQRVRDRLEALAFDDFSHGLGTAEDARLFGLFQEGVSGGEGAIGKGQCEGPHTGGLQNKILQKYKYSTSPHVVPLL